MERFALSLRSVLGEELAGEALQFDADLIDAFGLRGRKPFHHRSAVRNDLDQALRFKLAQSLTNQGAAHSRHLTQAALGQPVAAIEMAEGDGVSNAFGDALPQRRSDLFHLEIGSRGERGGQRLVPPEIAVIGSLNPFALCKVQRRGPRHYLTAAKCISLFSLSQISRSVGKLKLPVTAPASRHRLAV